MTNFENSRRRFERMPELEDEQACHVALSESNEPGHKQIYSRQLKELNLNYSADASVQFYRSSATIKISPLWVIYIYPWNRFNKIILDKYFFQAYTVNLKNSTKKGTTFTIFLIEIFLVWERERKLYQQRSTKSRSILNSSPLIVGSMRNYLRVSLESGNEINCPLSPLFNLPSKRDKRSLSFFVIR